MRVQKRLDCWWGSKETKWEFVRSTTQQKSVKTDGSVWAGRSTFLEASSSSKFSCGCKPNETLKKIYYWLKLRGLESSELREQGVRATESTDNKRLGTYRIADVIEAKFQSNVQESNSSEKLFGYVHPEPKFRIWLQMWSGYIRLCDSPSPYNPFDTHAFNVTEVSHEGLIMSQP